MAFNFLPKEIEDIIYEYKRQLEELDYKTCESCGTVWEVHSINPSWVFYKEEPGDWWYECHSYLGFCDRCYYDNIQSDCEFEYFYESS